MRVARIKQLAALLPSLMGLVSTSVTAEEAECLVSNDPKTQQHTLSLQACLAKDGAYLPASEKLELWREAAMSGDSQAQYRVADALAFNPELVDAKPASLAWYRLAADNGHQAATLSLGLLYEQGELVKKDIEFAYQLYQKAMNIESVELPAANSQASIAQLRTNVTLADQELARKKALERALQQELRSVSSGGDVGDALEFELSAARHAVKRKQAETERERQDLVKSRAEISAIMKTLGGNSKASMTADQIEWIRGQVSSQQEELLQEQAAVAEAIETRETLANRTSSSSAGANNSAILAMESKEAKNKALAQYLSDLDGSIQHRTSSTDRRQKKLDFLQKRITKLKQKNKREVSSDDRVLMQRALTELDHRYQGKIDYLADNLQGEMGRVDALSGELAAIEKQSHEREKLVKVITERLDDASKTVDRQSKLVEQQSSDLRLAIDSMNQAHAGQSNTSSSAEKLWQETEVQVVPPEIVISWPKGTDNNGGLLLSPPAGSVLNLVGGVQSNAQLTRFTVDGETVELDKNGLFTSSFEVSANPIDIELVAFDESGAKAATKVVRVVPEIKPPTRTAEFAQIAETEKNLNNVDFGNYHALIFGNNNYQPSDFEVLDTAENDARSMAQLLRESYGFEVELVLNATRDETLKALEKMRAKLTDRDNLLIFYAGHGIMDPESNQGYWVPVDGASDSSARWISNATITDQIRAMTARNVMVVADSCYSGSLMRSGVMSMRSGLTPEKKIKRVREDLATATRVALSSGGLQPVIDSIDNSPNSVFTGAMLKTLKQNVSLLDADSLATEVSHSVALATKDNVRQVPRFSPLIRAGHEGGEFYFVPASWRAENN